MGGEGIGEKWTGLCVLLAVEVPPDSAAMEVRGRERLSLPTVVSHNEP